MIADAILDCSAPGDLVLDNFSGAGSTILAAEGVGRTCHAIELDPLYVDTAVKRWEKQTGRHAIHAVRGQTFEAAEARNG
jgi:DNA modification methylase